MREVCPNYEVVVLQPQTLTTLHLGYCRLTLHFNISVPPHILLLSFMEHSFPSCSYRLTIRSLLLSKPYPLSRYPPPLPVQSSYHLGVALTRHPPASAARLCAPRRVPAYAVVPSLVCSPLFLHRPATKFLSAPGGVAHSRSLRVSIYLSCHPQGLLRILAPSGPWYHFRVDFRENSRGQGAFTPW